MLLVAPDPALGIAPERTARVRALLDALPPAPGVAVALPGGGDGVLDALVLRPDGVLGLLPVGAAAPVPAGAGAPAPADDAGAEDAAAEIERLLCLVTPVPTAPRQVVPYPREGGDDDGGSLARGRAGSLAAAARLVLTTRSGSGVLDGGEVVRIFAALRLVEHTPGSAALAAAGFPDAGSGSAAGVVPAARSATSSHPSAPSLPSIDPPSSPSSATSPVDPSPSADPSSADPSPSADPSSAGPSSADPSSAVPETGPIATPATAPVASPARTAGRAGTRTDITPSGGSSSERSAEHRPATGRLPASWLAEAAGSGGPRSSRRAAARRAERRLTLPSWVWTWRGLAVAAAATFLLALGAALLVAGGGGAPSTVGSGPDPATTRTADGVTFQRRVVASDPTCDGHAYGQAARFFRDRPCRQLDRALWSTEAGGAPMVVSVSQVRMSDAGSATALKALVDADGTGNVSDLLREGRSYPGAPPGLRNSGYASDQTGDTLLIVETDRSDGGRADEPTLDALARQALVLRP